MRTNVKIPDTSEPLWWTVLNAGWFSVLIGTTIGIAGLYAAWVFYKRAKPRPSLTTTSDSTLLVGPVEESVAGKLQIRFDDRAVPQVTSTTIGFWNDGTTIFRATDIVSKDPLRIRIENGKILQAHVESVSRDVIDASLGASGESEVFIRFEFLEPQDALAVRVLHSGSVRCHFIRHRHRIT